MEKDGTQSIAAGLVRAMSNEEPTPDTSNVGDAGPASSIVARMRDRLANALRTVYANPVARSLALWKLRQWIDLDDDLLDAVLALGPCAWRRIRRALPLPKEDEDDEDG
jgi:hypothetical protein